MNWSALDYFDASKPFDDSLKLAFEYLKMDVLFNIANTSYKFIESQGFNSLTNDSLRIRVTEMYERHLRNIITRENRNWDMVDEELMPLMMEHFVSTPTADENLSFSVEAINTPLDLGALRQDPKFRNVIVRLQGFLLMRLRWQKEALDTLELLILDVQKEIERLS